MASWAERRGFTLRFDPPDGGDVRFARVALVQRQGLLGGWCNVREARAEVTRTTSAPPRSLGDGRLLSWRPVSLTEAQTMLASRLQTLEALGYQVLDEDETPQRGPWDWLRDLVQRQLTSELPSAAPDEAEDEEERAGSLDAALARLGVDPQMLLGGLAEILGLDRTRLEAPTSADVAAVEPETLAGVLEFAADHREPEVRAMATAWMRVRSTAYELDGAVVERWLRDGRHLGRALADRVPGEGLALLGASALRRLAADSRSPRIRADARRWLDRLPTA